MKAIALLVKANNHWKLLNHYKFNGAVFDAGIAVLAMLVYVMLAVSSGPDVGWDLRNYHFYIGYAWLHGGFDHNIIPAQIQSWFNPVLDGFMVWLMQKLPPIAVTAGIGFLQSLNIPLLLVIVHQILRPDSLHGWPRRLVPAFALMIGAGGAMLISELGASFGDALANVPVMAALAMLGHTHMILRDSRGPRRTGAWIAVAGIMAGCACGLKMTNLIYMPSFALMFFWLGQRPAQRLGYLILFGVGAAAGLVLTDGAWAWKLWVETGNPVFPLLNGIFKSPLMDAASRTLDDRYQITGFGAGLRLPFATAWGRDAGAEVFFRDPRFALAVVALSVLLWRAWKQPAQWVNAILVFFWTGYILWMLVSGVQRYLVPLELLSGPLLILAVLQVSPFRARVWTAGILAALIMLATTYPQWGYRTDWAHIADDGRWFRAEVPPALTADRQMFLIMGDEPLSYVIPFFRADARFVRMQSNMKLSPDNLLYRRRAEAVAAHAGPLFTLGVRMPTAGQEALLASYGLVWRDPGCVTFNTGVEYLYACPLQRGR